MSDMVERVARAIWTAREERFPRFTQRREPDETDRHSGAWDFCIEEARSAIEAMREPTEIMMHEHWMVEEDGNLAQWQAAIDAALASEPKP